MKTFEKKSTIQNEEEQDDKENAIKETNLFDGMKEQSQRELDRKKEDAKRKQPK